MAGSFQWGEPSTNRERINEWGASGFVHSLTVHLDEPSTNGAGGLSPSVAGRGRGVERVGRGGEGPWEALSGIQMQVRLTRRRLRGQRGFVPPAGGLNEKHTVNYFPLKGKYGLAVPRHLTYFFT